MHNPTDSVVKTVCVFCGSSLGDDPTFAGAAEKLGTLLAGERYNVVCGGSGAGLLGILARAVYAAGGQVTAIIPDFLHRRLPALREASETIVTQTMHERKQAMFERADAFITLPGGIGTLEETIEMLTWAQLNIHAKPIVLMNPQEYWNPLLRQMHDFVERGFAAPQTLDPLLIVSSPEDAIHALRTALNS